MKDGTQIDAPRRKRTYQERVEELRQKELARVARRQASLVKQYKEAVPVRTRAIEQVEKASTRVREIVTEYAANLAGLEDAPTAPEDIAGELDRLFNADDVRDWIEAFKDGEPTDHTDGTDGVLAGQLSIGDN